MTSATEAIGLSGVIRESSLTRDLVGIKGTYHIISRASNCLEVFNLQLSYLKPEFEIIFEELMKYTLKISTG